MPDCSLTVLFTERTGALERIVSLLRRRGFPVTGVTIERTHEEKVGRMSISVQQPSVAAQVRHHLLRLPEVREVRVENRHALRRAYALIRVRCSGHEQELIRATVSEFGGRALAAAPDSLVIEAVGQQSQMDALFAALASYPIEESARTSPIALSHDTTAIIPADERNARESTGSH